MLQYLTQTDDFIANETQTRSPDTKNVNALLAKNFILLHCHLSDKLMIKVLKLHVSLQLIYAFLDTGDLTSQLETLDGLDLLCRVQTLWAGTGAIHNCMAPVELELIIDSVEPLFRILITTVSYPPTKTAITRELHS